MPYKANARHRPNANQRPPKPNQCPPQWDAKAASSYLYPSQRASFALLPYDLSIRAQAQGGVALIVAGNDDNFHLQDNILNAANLAYETFAEGGIPLENIRYLSAIDDERTDVDGDGNSEVYAPSTSANIEEALTTWATTLADSENPFYLYMVDHGGIDIFKNYGNNNPITPAQLDTWLTALEEATDVPINVIYEACNSGSFIDTVDGLEEISAPGRVIITSTSRTNNAYTTIGEGGAYFSDAFFTGLGQSQDLYTSFQWGVSAVEATGLWQIPWLDDNGNAVPNEPTEGEIAQSRGLANLSLSGEPPTIDNISPPTTIFNGEGLIRSQVRDDTSIANVWAVVYPPSFSEPDPVTDGTTPELNLPQVQLSDSDGDGQYVGVYENFTDTGTYRLVVYAKDSEGNLSLPKAIEIDTTSTTSGQALFLPLIVR